MRKLAKLIRQLNQQSDRRDNEKAFIAALRLWQYPSYEKEIQDDRRREAYLDALARGAGIIAAIVQAYHSTENRFKFLDALQGPESAVSLAELTLIHKEMLERIYSVDHGHIVEAAGYSHKESAAYQLGILLKEARCHNSAVIWFQRCLRLARVSGVRANILGNLHQLAWNLETLARFTEAGRCYDEMLEMLVDAPPRRQPVEWLVHAAMYHVRHGDQARGEAMMRELLSTQLKGLPPLDTQLETLPLWFYHAVHSLGMIYADTERFQEALEMAETVMETVARFDRPDWVRDATHGLTARIYVRMGQLDRALEELAEVFDVKATKFLRNGEGVNIDLWIDIARIHVANQHYAMAVTAYEILAYNLGALLGDPHLADTTRLRFYWLQRMAFVVHEMVSVWLTITDTETRRGLEAKVANALLQLKANLFLAMQIHKNLYLSTHNLFLANRRYARAARSATGKPDDAEAMLELEGALWDREQIERLALSTAHSLPGGSTLFRYDFQQSQELGANTLLLDYSLVDHRPPQRGLEGPSRGQRYFGIRLGKGNLRLADLGKAEEIEGLCGSLMKAVSTVPLSDQLADESDLENLTERLYDRILAPFEPLSSSLLFSPDGMLAALPFHALIHQDRYLIEDREIAYCHSLLPKETLTIRGLSPQARALPSPVKTALVLGNPDYETNSLDSLPGTKREVEEIAKLWSSEKLRSERHSTIGEVRIHTGAQATASRLLGVDRPRYLHIAAHGMFDESQARLFAGQTITFGGYYRRYEEMGASSITQLDNALLRSTLILADDPASDDIQRQLGARLRVEDPVNGALLTALELASLNLYSCKVVVLSACETGVGVTEYGAGVLGFQYAIYASCALAGMVSLWKVPDWETSDFMVEFYRKLFQGEYAGYGAKAAYLATMRSHCRRNGQPVHPYYWAAFVFLDQDYDHPFK